MNLQMYAGILLILVGLLNMVLGGLSSRPEDLALIVKLTKSHQELREAYQSLVDGQERELEALRETVAIYKAHYK